MDAIVFLSQDKIAEASDYIRSLQLEATMQTAFWHLFDSKQRSAIKKYREENK
jgi:hypothetical protein